MDHELDEPKMGLNVHRRTTQLNLWMIVAIVLFFVLAGLYILRVARHPPRSTQEMKEGAMPVNHPAMVG
jgi:hypothetical protein